MGVQMLGDGGLPPNADQMDEQTAKRRQLQMADAEEAAKGGPAVAVARAANDAAGQKRRSISFLFANVL